MNSKEREPIPSGRRYRTVLGAQVCIPDLVFGYLRLCQEDLTKDLGADYVRALFKLLDWHITTFATARQRDKRKVFGGSQ